MRLAQKSKSHLYAEPMGAHPDGDLRATSQAPSSAIVEWTPRDRLEPGDTLPNRQYYMEYDPLGAGGYEDNKDSFDLPERARLRSVFLSIMY